jgi:hypothetical protein
VTVRSVVAGLLGEDMLNGLRDRWGRAVAFVKECSSGSATETPLAGIGEPVAELILAPSANQALTMIAFPGTHGCWPHQQMYSTSNRSRTALSQSKSSSSSFESVVDDDDLGVEMVSTPSPVSQGPSNGMNQPTLYLVLVDSVTQERCLYRRVSRPSAIKNSNSSNNSSIVREDEWGLNGGGGDWIVSFPSGHYLIIGTWPVWLCTNVVAFCLGWYSATSETSP